MSCHHRDYSHGCDWPPPPPHWYDAYGYRPRRYRDEDEEERPRRRRDSGHLRRRAAEYDYTTEEVTGASLQSRAEALREELVRIEEDLKKLSAAPGPEPET